MDGPLLEEKTYQEFLEEPLDDVLESGKIIHNIFCSFSAQQGTFVIMWDLDHCVITSAEAVQNNH